MNITLSPIALFVYDRIEQTKLTIESLRNNHLADKSILYIFSDGAKDAHTEKKVDVVRGYIKDLNGFDRVIIIEREKNYGLKKSIESGIEHILSRYTNIIVIEDDLELSPYFLKYMNEALELYKNEVKVMQISGYATPNNIFFEQDALFLPFITSWGWATWRRAWAFYLKEPPECDLITKNEELLYQFNLGGKVKYSEMLEKANSGKINSWAINWYLACFINGGLSLYPKKSLVKNIGFDGTGVNCRFHTLEQDKIITTFEVKNFPKSVSVSELQWEYVDSMPRLKLSIRSVIKRLIQSIIR
jgi:GT2 family glycosyltransferase